MTGIEEVKARLLALPGIEGVAIHLGIDVRCTNPTTDLPDETWYELGKIETNLMIQGCILRPTTLIGELPRSWRLT